MYQSNCEAFSNRILNYDVIEFGEHTADIVVVLTIWLHLDGLVQDCTFSSALAMEILQSCTKPSICGCCFHNCRSRYGSVKTASTELVWDRVLYQSLDLLKWNLSTFYFPASCTPSLPCKFSLLTAPSAVALAGQGTHSTKCLWTL